MTRVVLRAGVLLLAAALASPAVAKEKAAGGGGPWRRVFEKKVGTAKQAASGLGVTFAAFNDRNQGISALGNGEVRTTGDGGERWVKAKYPPTKEWDGTIAIDILNRDRAWACGSQFACGSSDGGKVWHPLNGFTMGNELGRYVSLGTAQLGWLASSSVLLTSSDGGKAWSPIALPPEVTGDIMAIDREPRAGYLLLNKGLVLATSDNGQTWERHSLPLDDRKPVGFVPNTPVDAVRFRDPRHGTVVFLTQNPEPVFLVFQTQDGGATWEEEPVPPELRSARGSVFLSRDARYLTITDVSRGVIQLFEHP